MTKLRFLLAGLVALAFVATGRADPLFTTTSVSVLTNGTTMTTQNNINAIIGSSAGNFDFSNTVGNTTGGSAVGDTRAFISVGSDKLTSYNDKGGGVNPITYTDATGTYSVVKVFAVTGTSTVTAAGGLTMNRVTGGAIGYYGILSTAAYNKFDPLTFGATNAAGTGTGKLLALFPLANPVAINQGPNGAGGNQPVSAVNTVALNAQTPQDSQGHFLFNYDPTKGVPDFLRNFDPTGIPTDPKNILDGKGLHAFISQRLTLNPTTDPTNILDKFRFIDPAGPDAAAGLTALNTIAANLGVSTTFAGTAAFAPVFGPDATGNGYNPYNGPSQNIFPGSGDFGTDFGNSDFPGLFERPFQTPGSPVPEIDPSSIAGALTLLGGGLMYLTERRRRSKK